MSTYFPIYQKNVKSKKFFSFLGRNCVSISIIFFIILSLGLVLVDIKKEFLSPVKSKLNEFFYSMTFVDDISRSFKDFYNRKFAYLNRISEQEYSSIVESIERLYRAENQQLKDLLNFVDEYRAKITTTTAIIDLKNHNIILRVGSNNGIKPDQIIINEIGLVGKVTEVYENFSKGILVTNKKFKIPVISGETRRRFILNGQSGEYLKPLYLSENLNNGEILLSSEGLYTSGIQIARCEENRIKVLVDTQKINFVSVLESRT